MATQRGSGFIGLDKYLAANRKKAEDMAGGLSGGVETAGGEATGWLEDAQRGFMRDVGASMPQVNEGAPLSAADAAALGTSAYTGPNSLGEREGWDAARQKADKASQGVNALNSFAGRQAMLQDQYGKQGGYTQGQQRLDSFLTGAAGGNRFEQLKQQYGGLSDAFGTANTASQKQAQTAAESAAATAKKYGDMAPGLAAKEAEDAEKKRKAEAARIRQEETAAKREAIRDRRPGRGRQDDMYAP